MVIAATKLGRISLYGHISGCRSHPHIGRTQPLGRFELAAITLCSVVLASNAGKSLRTRLRRAHGLSCSGASLRPSFSDGKHEEVLHSRFRTSYGACLYSTSSSADKIEQRFLHRRLRGVHVPASSNIARRSLDEEQRMEALKHFSFPAIQKRPGAYAALLRWCGKVTAGMLGMLIHDHIIKDGLEHSVVLQNLLVQMYAHCGLMSDARYLFELIPYRDEFSWNFMIRACGQHGESTETMQLFEMMLGEGVLPNKFIYTSILLAYSSREVLAQGERLHARIIGNAFDSDVLLGNTLVSMYCKCGNLDDARGLFDRLNEQDVVSWNAMVAVHTKCGQGKDALYFSKQMQQEGVMPNMATFISVLDACANEAVIIEGRRLHACFAGSGFESDLVLGTALINMYGKYGELDHAWRIFSQMPERNTVSWNGMITAYALHNQAKHALVLFDQLMQEGVMPDKFIFVSMLSAHATKEDLADGKRIHSRLVGSDFVSDAIVRTAVLNMFCKCGSMEEAENIFDYIAEPDDVLWTAMISGYAQHGQGKKALQLFERMQVEGPHPSKVTYMSVLSACSRAGLVDEGVEHLLSMSRDRGIKPTVDHYNCVVDLLARTGRLDEAEDMIMSMSCEATIVTWTSLLDACKKQFDVERGERAAKRIFELDPESTLPYISLSNIYVAASRADDAHQMINTMKQ